jgi:hypothetical protein
MPTFGPNDKPYIDITHEDEWEVDFTVHTPLMSFSARQFEPSYPNQHLAGRRDIMLNGIASDQHHGPEGSRVLAGHLAVAQEMILQIGILDARAFLEANRAMVRR